MNWQSLSYKEDNGAEWGSSRYPDEDYDDEKMILQFSGSIEVINL